VGCCMGFSIVRFYTTNDGAAFRQAGAAFFCGSARRVGQSSV
jgi:hypothetical protein